MNFDEMQKAWGSQKGQLRLTIDPSLLLKEVQRNKRSFEVSVFWRDVREVGVAILMTILFAFWGIRGDGWPWFVLAALVLWIGVFMVVDRIRQKRKMPVFSEPLKACIESSLRQVSHQIWLLENVLWWYLLPPATGSAVVICYYAWQVRDTWWLSLTVFFGTMGFCSAVFYGVYRLNQWAVRTELQPRKEELEILLDSLTAGEE